jgi:hypothetical protein
MIKPNRKLPLWFQRTLRFCFPPDPSWEAGRNFILEMKKIKRKNGNLNEQRLKL